MRRITYKSSGVDILKASEFKKGIKPLLRKSFNPAVLKDIGGFGSFYSLAKEKYQDPVLVSSTDGVGTKLKIAALANKHDTIGIDAVAMNVNDILCTGAKPLFFLDYIAFNKVSQKILTDVIKGINNGCIEAGCALIGGEAAQMPGFYKAGEYDIAGFCVGIVEKKKIIDGSKIKAGDIIIGLASSGLHSNGYSLVRKVFSERELKKYSTELLKPTRIYVKPVLSLLSTIDHRLPTIKGISHITGGAFYDKIARILPDNVDAVINKNSWQAPRIFKLIQDKGNVPERDMYHTLNMGIGMVLVVTPESTAGIKSLLAKFRLRPRVIGKIIRGNKRVRVI